MKDTIRELTEAFGPSGFEHQVCAIVRRLIAPHVDEVRVDALGSLIAVRKGTGGGRRIMLAAHADEIGIMVSYIDEKGFCRFSAVGGVNPLNTLGGRVQFENGIVGVVGCDKIESGYPPLEKLYLDVAATSRADCPVRVGDVACFQRPMVEVRGHLTAKAMDDRVGCAVLVETLKRLGPSPHDLCVAFTSQEEVGLRGATTAAFGAQPDVAVAVDVTLAADVPEPSVKMAVALDQGPAIKVKDGGMLATPWVKDWMVDTAVKAALPYQMEVLVGGTTDARAIQTTREGVPAGCLSIPCRYVHSPSETVSAADCENAVRLLVAMLSAPTPR